jgi:hypothetical protein
MANELNELNELFDICISKDMHVSLTYHTMTKWSVEIYKGSGELSYSNIFYIDGGTKKRAIKKALKFIKKHKG